MKLIQYSALLVFCIFLSSDVYSQDAGEIVRIAEENMRGESMRGKMSMKIVRPSWSREMQFKVWSLGEDFSLIKVTSPARDEGTGYLKRGNEIWNWQPTIERSIKMPPSMMSQSWMGSDFSNDDLVRQSSLATDYSYSLLGKEELEGYTCYKIELKPKPHAAVVWGKVIMWISENDYLELKTEFYDENEELVNTMVGSEIEEQSGRTLPTKLTVIPANEQGHKTIVNYLELNFGVEIPENFFTIRNLKKL